MKISTLHKGIVNSSYTLLYVKSTALSGWEKLWHIKNDSGVGQTEYTLCGMSWVDGDADAYDHKFIKSKKGGKITCPNCLKMINWCKEVK